LRRWYLFGLVLYGVVLLFRLDRVPLINPDEAAYTEPAWTLLTDGRFGAPMYTGMFAIDQRWYFLWPGYAVLAVVPYAIWGVDLAGLRLLSGAFGAGLLTAIWWLSLMVGTPPVQAPGSFRGGSPSSGVLRLQSYSSWAQQPVAVAFVAWMLAALHPTLFFLSRFGRPEIAVAFFAVLSTALAVRAWRTANPTSIEGRSATAKRKNDQYDNWLHIAAGAAAGLSFLMHQYGGFAIAALALCYLVAPAATLRTRAGKGLLAGLGVGTVVLPWLVWIWFDWTEFAAQLTAQLEYQRWRYAGLTLWGTLAREIPGRYLLSMQDFHTGWDGGRALLEALIGPVAAGTSDAGALPPHLRLLAVARYWLAVGPAGLWRWPAFALLSMVVVAGLMPRGRRVLVALPVRWVMVPLLVWLAGLAAIPNKWEGYTGAVAAYLAVAGASLLPSAVRLMLSDEDPVRRSRGEAGISFPLGVRLSKQLAGGAFVALIAGNVVVWFFSDLQALWRPPSSYATYAAQIRSLVPPGAPVASTMREWFTFAGRNPAYTIEFRSVPAFDTSLLALIAEQRPEYLVLHRNDTAGTPGGAEARAQRYHFVYPPWEDFYAYVDRSTDFIGTVTDPSFGTVEVRRIVRRP
jgi:hypothetical protein